MPTRYYQLVSALPHMPHFRRATRLPMSRRRLEQRLTLLQPRDQADLTAARDLVTWNRQPVNRTTAQLVALYHQVGAQVHSATLRDLLAFRMNMRTVMVALRLRRHGEGPPEEAWGVGPYVRRIESQWAEAGFGLDAVFPWVGQAATLLEKGDAMELEGLLMDQSWRRLSQVADPHPFGFEQVFAFVFKLDILTRWLSYDPDEARSRFEQLILEVTRDHQQLFG